MFSCSEWHTHCVTCSTTNITKVKKCVLSSYYSYIVQLLQKKKPTRVTWLSYASKNPRRKYVFQKSKIYARINIYWTYTRHVVVFCYNLFTCLINFFSCKWCTSFRGQICKFLTVYKSLEIFKTLQNLIRLGYFLSLQLRKEKTIFIVFFL